MTTRSRLIVGELATLGLAGLASVLPLPRQFVIFTTGRTGSELLVQLLDSHPQLRCESEILSRRRPWPEAYVRGRVVRSLIPAGDGNTAVKAYGWKLITGHLRWYPDLFPDPSSFMAPYAQPPRLLITIRRRNLLAQALSADHATRTQYHFDIGEAGGYERYTADPERLLALLYWYEEDAQWLTATVGDLPHLALQYEDDLLGAEQQQHTADRIFAALGLPSSTVTATVVPVAPPDPLARIENADEVVAALHGTRFASLLDPVD